MIPPNLSIADAAWRVFPNVILFDGGRYVVAALVMSAILWVVQRSAYRVRVIQDRRPSAKDYRREIGASARSVLIYALVATPALWMRSNGYAAGAYEGAGSAITIAIYVVALLVAHDAYFYWTHRAMHHKRLFKLFHRTHHWSATPTPFAAYSFDWQEAIVQALFVSIWICIVPTPDFALFVFLGIMIIRNVWGHCGAELHPAGMADHPFWGLLSTTTHHDLHHCGSFAHNYGLYFTWWDRMMGTEHPRYREIYREITTRPRKSPEIVGIGL